MKLKPKAVLSMGGYVAGPGGMAAWFLRRRLIIHEQNAISGLTNRLTGRSIGWSSGTEDPVCR